MEEATGREERIAEAERLLGETAAERVSLRAEDVAALVANHPALRAELKELWAEWCLLDAALGEEARNFDHERRETDRMLDEVRGSTEFGARYQIEGEVGQGGMGVVYRVLDRKLARPLAMKVLLGQASAAHDGTPAVAPQQLARFLNEARLTSQLEHPGIVPVYEVGVDPGGRAYFTMKLVKGRTLGEVLELRAKGSSEWTTTRVLGLIQRVCETLEYAHQHGVIHRDLKPANVMVGDFGEVYLMDWGLARDLSVVGASESGGGRDPLPTGTARGRVAKTPSSTTREGHVLGTPAYMSPEQARGEASVIGAQTDVYSLGAMLYQLVTGHPPHCEPGSDQSTAAVLSRVASSEPLRVPPALAPPELAAITEKALHPDRRIRYQQIRELGEELRAFAEGRVVRTFRTGAWVELSKWVRRNRGLAATFGLLVGVLLAAAVTFAHLSRQSRKANLDLAKVNAELSTSQQQVLESLGREQALGEEARESARVAEARRVAADGAARRAVEERDNAMEVAGFLEQVFSGLRPSVAMGRDTTLVRELLDHAAPILERDRLACQPWVRARLARRLGATYREIGDLPAARPMLELALLAAGHDPDLESAEWLEILTQLGHLAQDDGDLPLAEAYHREVLARSGPDDAISLPRAIAMGNLAGTLYDAGQRVEAVEWFLACVATHRAVGGGDTFELAAACTGLASVQIDLGRLPEAEASAREGLHLLECLFPAIHPDTALAAETLGAVLLAQNRVKEGVELLVRSLATKRAMFVGPHASIAAGLNALGFAQLSLGALELASGTFRESLEMHRRVYPRDHVDLANSIGNLASALRRQGQLAESEALQREALGMRIRLFPGGHPSVATNLQALSSLARLRRDFAEAEKLLREALRMREKLLPQPSREIADTQVGLGLLLSRELDRAAEAEPLLRAALDAYERTTTGRDPAIANASWALGTCLGILGRYAEGEPHLLAAEEISAANAAQAPAALREARKTLVDFYAAWSRVAGDPRLERERERWESAGAELPRPR